MPNVILAEAQQQAPEGARVVKASERSCSFCGCVSTGPLIAGDGVRICEPCLSLAEEFIAAPVAQTAPPSEATETSHPDRSAPRGVWHRYYSTQLGTPEGSYTDDIWLFSVAQIATARRTLLEKLGSAWFVSKQLQLSCGRCFEFLDVAENRGVVIERRREQEPT
jgi:hypothetical protein